MKKLLCFLLAALLLCTLAILICFPLLCTLAPGVEVLAEYTLTPEEAAAQQHKSVIVAVRDSHLMATAFHPELTQVGREG